MKKLYFMSHCCFFKCVNEDDGCKFNFGECSLYIAVMSEVSLSYSVDSLSSFDVDFLLYSD